MKTISSAFSAWFAALASCRKLYAIGPIVLGWRRVVQLVIPIMSAALGPLWITEARAQEAYAGVWAAGSDNHFLWAGADWAGFKAKWEELAQQNLRLVDFETYLSGGQRKYSGVWRAGNDAHFLLAGVDWASFRAKWEELGQQNLRLVRFKTYVDGGQRKYAGVWRAGSDAHFLWADSDWATFKAKWEELGQQNLRLVDFETYVDGGQRKFAGVWRAGNDAHFLWAGSDWATFKAKWEELSQQNLRLVDFETYVDGGQRKFAGVWRAGNDAHFLWAGVDWENFTSKWNELGKQNLRLVRLTTYPGCSSACANQVVMPDDPSTPQSESYNYRITMTATHCPGLPGTCGSPAPSATVVYSWPVDTEGTSRYVRLSALQVSQPFLTLPFSETAVKRVGIWRYGNGTWHHAGDYMRDDQKTFRVRASAPGRVIFIGWDSPTHWSGNTMIVSHDVGGVQDAYRTIYMHLRNGPANDCDAAWSKTIPTLSGNNLAKYTEHLTATKCTQNVATRNPTAEHWGKESERIDMSLLGKTVARGAPLAWAGNTGPGGKMGPGTPNTHLHIFWARRDPTNNRWYFVDPYGIYALPTCYPVGITDALTSACARYPIGWQGGRPQYPQ